VTSMSDERYIALAEVKEYLEQESKGRDFTPEQRISYDHASKIAKLSAEKARELVAELKAVSYVPDTVAVKIADIVPTHPEDVRVLFAKERIVLEKKQIEQILKLVEKYL
jgi:DNA-directed RNA polymerase subunit F